MRVLQVAPFFYPHAGGVESHVRGISRELARQGHSVIVLTSRHDPALPEREEFEGYTILRTPCWGVWFNTPVNPEVGRWARELGADVAHLHFPPPLTPYFAARGLDHSAVPVCVTYHCDLYLATAFGRLATELFNHVFLPSILRRADRVIVHTESYGQTSRGLGGRPFEVIPSSVDLLRFRPDVDGSAVRERLGLGEGPVLAFAGRLVPHKGLEPLLRAVSRLPPKVRLLVVGRGPELPAMQELARRLGIAERVRFCSEVSDAELPAYLRAADLFVFPSTNRLEGFGLAVAEAMAAGLPVIVTDMPGVREVIQPGREGLLTEPLLEGDLVERIQELMDDPGRRRSMGAAGRRRAEELFDVRAVTRSLVRTYEGLAAAG
ncbi:MAG TPA: glycosyltransferase family 4 protein [Thermoplasmata archaeon]|nr:glycosyltransferase family 4 protein [Thermoplasmata archaeon]